MNQFFGEDDELDDETCKAKILAVLKSDRFRVLTPRWHLMTQLVHIMRSTELHRHYGLQVHSKMLLEMDVQLGHLMLRYPQRVLQLFTDAVQDLQMELVERNKQTGEVPAAAMQASQPDDSQHLPSQSTQGSGESGCRSAQLHPRLSLKVNVHVRLQWLPAANRKANISSIRQSDVNTMLQISGTVVRSGQLKVLEAEKVFTCNNSKCHGEVRVRAALNEVGGMLQHPKGPCPNCKRSSSYAELKGRGTCWDYQEIRVQEQVQRIGMGSVPRSITVLLLHELVDLCKAGDDVVVTGIPMQRWDTPVKNARCQLETVIQASSVVVLNENRGAGRLTEEQKEEFNDYWREIPEGYSKLEWHIRARNAIVHSIAPQLHGLFLVKLSVLLTLVGAPGFTDPKRGNKVRGDIHLLMVGDPGTGKSHCLRYAAKVATRSVLTTGVGTTSAGLTCTAVRDGSEYQLEAGALVLADRGLCCIDEFGSIKASDRTTIHEAMEQQTLSVAKAGLITSLNTRCSVMAACNPKGKYDFDRELSANTGIASPLLSRFDIVLVLVDRANTKWDKTVSEFLLIEQLRQDRSHRRAQMAAAAAAANRSGSGMGGGSQRSSGAESSCDGGGYGGVDGDLISDSDDEDGDERWSLEKLRDYIAYAKEVFPQLNHDSQAARVLHRYYTSQRKWDSREAARTTLRLLESLVRIATAHARLMLHAKVELMDAVYAVLIVDSLMDPSRQASGDDCDAGLHFSALETDFVAERRRLLIKINLGNILEEIEREENSSGQDFEAPSSPPPRVSPPFDPTQHHGGICGGLFRGGPSCQHDTVENLAEGEGRGQRKRTRVAPSVSQRRTTSQATHSNASWFPFETPSQQSKATNPSVPPRFPAGAVQNLGDDGNRSQQRNTQASAASVEAISPAKLESTFSTKASLVSVNKRQRRDRRKKFLQ